MTTAPKPKPCKCGNIPRIYIRGTRSLTPTVQCDCGEYLAVMSRSRSLEDIIDASSLVVEQWNNRCGDE